MKLWIGFAGGLAAGVVGTVLVVSAPSARDQAEAQPLAHRPALPAAAVTAARSPVLGQPPEQRQVLPATLPQAAAGATAVDAVLSRLATDPDAVLDERALQDLTCSMRRDRTVAVQVRERLLSSSSHGERFALMRLLAQDDSLETASLVRDLIVAPESEAKRLGYDLLRSMDGSSRRPELTHTLLAALQQESDPQYLTALIASLSIGPLDDMSKSVVAQRLQSILAVGHTEVRASALVAMPQVVDTHTLALAVKRHLDDADAAVRLAALQAAWALNGSRLDVDVVNTVRRMSLSSAEPEAVRSVAQALLARAQPPSGS